MSVRYLAQELYRLTHRVEELEKALAALGEALSPERARLEGELLKASKEQKHLREVLESKKEKVSV